VAALLATNSAPIVPPAPGRFSTTTFCPSRPVSFSAAMRASVSALPPGANGATIFTGRAGQSSPCAGSTAPSMHRR
jgi:hypothetical protein